MIGRKRHRGPTLIGHRSSPQEADDACQALVRHLGHENTRLRAQLGASQFVVARLAERVKELWCAPER